MKKIKRFIVNLLGGKKSKCSYSCKRQKELFGFCEHNA